MEAEGARRWPIGTVAARASVKVETIRYYERIGLMPAPRRTERGHRQYDPVQVRRLGFIRRSRELGFSIDEIRALLHMLDEGAYTCGEIKEITFEHLRRIRDKVADLQRLEAALAGMAAQCEGGTLPDCPILETLSG
ncbi:MAG: helix-turn-helix domain-containing protein [Gammaproteobacteria bacterium]|nr:helix-turn-helix domain-containing protein [Gammaproteobacteria bacterium]NIR82452.1 helix-turn-helix domain-containing protein [Gammaproteobacteria bacterium]NIR88448.1 helix-turn-helix domain-containing protein [Gammaproteobacteria bacterium]NIU03588.1 helix-turn-helix domain-containing protein [Gammaproteobacteria bacterium]NIV50940.1 MerR family transcriptional regulator [Gammaproteobacteria bacterium]